MIEDPDPLNAPEPGPEHGPVVAGKPKRARMSSGVRFGIVLVVCLALAVPVVGALAAPTAPPLAAGASRAPSASGKAPDVEGQGIENGNDYGNGHKLDKGHGNPFKGGHGPGKGPITIASISGSNLSLATEDGWTRTITVTSATVITKGGQTITAADLKAGDEIHFAQSRNADGSYTIVAIRVATPKTGGEVTAVTGSGITVKQKGGTTRVITVTGSTVYTLGSATGSKADVKVGREVEAEGTVNGDTFTATAVHVELARLGGTVTGKTADTVTVTTKGGTAATIHVSSSTTYRIKGNSAASLGNSAASLADIAVGDRVSAAGTLRSDGSLDAVTIRTGNGKGNDQNAKNGTGGGADMDDDDDAPAPAASAAPG